MNTIVALPGLHGSASLFAPLIRSSPPGFDVRALALNPEIATYAEHEAMVAQQLPAGSFSILAESFSGPLAVRLAAQRRVTAVVLCASFLTPPRSLALKAVAKAPLFRFGPPPALLAAFLCGGDMGLARQVAAEVRKVSPTVLAARAAETLKVNDTSCLGATHYPLLYLQAARDWVVPDRCFNDIQQSRPDVQRVRLDAPHLLLQTSPELAWQAMTPFLSKL